MEPLLRVHPLLNQAIDICCESSWMATLFMSGGLSKTAILVSKAVLWEKWTFPELGYIS